MNGVLLSVTETRQQHHLLEDRVITTVYRRQLFHSFFRSTHSGSPKICRAEADRKCYCVWAVFLQVLRGGRGGGAGVRNLNKHTLYPAPTDPPTLRLTAGSPNVCLRPWETRVVSPRRRLSPIHQCRRGSHAGLARERRTGSTDGARAIFAERSSKNI